MGSHGLNVQFCSPFDLNLSFRAFLLSQTAQMAFPDSELYAVCFLEGKVPCACLLQQEEETLTANICRSEQLALTKEAVLAKIRSLFPGDEQYGLWKQILTSERHLAKVMQRWNGYRIVQSPRLFPIFVLMISCQQVNMKFALELVRDMSVRFGETIKTPLGPVATMPLADRVVQCSPKRLREMRYSLRKAEYLVDVAKKCASGEWSLEQWSSDDNEAIIEELTRLRGIGRWTAEWILLLGLGRLDSIPAGDLGIRRVVSETFFGGELKTEKEVRKYATRWGGVAGWVAYTLLTERRVSTSIRQ